MSTFLEMQQRIADDLDRTDLTTQIKKAINRAIVYYEKEPLWFKESSATFTAVSGQEEYTYGSDSVPSDVAMIDIMERAYGGQKISMQEITPFELEAKQSLTATGIPDEFAQYEDKFKLYPIPNQSGITIYIKYTKTYDELSADGDTNDWLTYAEDLIEAKARWWINARILRDNDAAANDAAQEMDALDALRTKNVHKTGQGRVIPTQF
ncbi:MAG: phage adaptor protein [Burkholderiaceae bacterium]